MIEGNNFDQFEALLLNKEYKELSTKELELITSFCDSQNEFEQMKKISLNVGFSEESTPDPRIKNRLLKHLSEQKQPKAGWVGWNSNFPLWALLAVALSSSLITFFFMPQKIEVQEVKNKVIQIDTIKQIIFKTDTIYIKLSKTNKQQPIAKLQFNHKTEHTIFSNQKSPKAESHIKPKIHPDEYSQGRSLKQETDLKKFIVRMD